MYSKSNPVDVVGVDSDKLDKDKTFPEAYAFYIKLSSEPDNVWQSYLAKWNSALKVKQRKISVEGEKLRLVFVHGDNMQNYANYATWLVNWVNERVEEHNKKVALLEKEEIGKQETERKKEERMLQELRQVEPEPFTAPLEVTIKELASAYAKNDAAYKKYRSSILKIKGFVRGIEAKHDYITLTDEYKSPNNVLCVFGKGHTYELKSLKKGKMVTVMGEFEGSVVQLSMRHCNLLS
ncbi:hypothetical protein ACFLS8_03740 [Chloroflexota bacterium]